MSYSIGLDLGSNSIGWAVVDKDGNLCKFKKQRMHGTIISFQKSNKKSPTETRRAFRSARRRLQRKRQRVIWLQELMSDLILPVDPNFYAKLKYSYLSSKDEAFDYDNILHVDRGAYKSLAYNEKYPTIYHLRKALAENGREDIRLVYLALHHIVSNRGNFLYEGQNLSLKQFAINDSLQELFCKLDFDYENMDFDAIVDILSLKIKKGEKKDRLIEELKSSCIFCDSENKKVKAYVSEIANAILGYKFKFNILTEQEEKIEFSLSQELSDDILGLILEDDLELYDALSKVYSGMVLMGLISGDNIKTVSDCYINRFINHGKDLVVLKRAIRKYLPDKYYSLINAPIPEDYRKKRKKNDIKNTISYEMYMKNSGDYTRDAFVGRIKNELLKFDAIDPNDSDILHINQRIENGDFISKLRTTDNGSIPYQFNLEEMESILDNQGQYYPQLLDIKEKALKIVSFRIPYFVGPLQPKSPYSWIVRSPEKITPWNFESVVDFDASEKAFIDKMTLNCSELHDQPVLPKCSPLYQRYCVLNELANINVNGNRLSPACRLKACDELFAKEKRITKARFIDWIIENQFADTDMKITGFADEKAFLSSLSTMIDFKKILQDSVDYSAEPTRKMIEDIVEKLTVLSSKDRVERYIVANYSNISREQAKKLSKIKCSGWGSFSSKLLTGIFSRTESGEPVSIMDLLETTQLNFNEIKFKEAYQFNRLIEEYNSKSWNQNSIDDYISQYPISPAAKRIVRVAHKAVKEVVRVMGGEVPEAIYIESASGEWPSKEKKKRTNTRYESVKKQLEEINDELYAEAKHQLNSNKELLSKDMTVKQMLYFMQNCKCMYSGKPLFFDELEKYELDHIIPRCYIRDNSISNLVLVYKKENQRKADSLLLSDDVIASQSAYWKSLLDKKLITRKKFQNLTRREISADDIKGFVERQLVETRQETKLLMDVLRQEYGGCVYGVSARLTSSIRKQNENAFKSLVKVREVNDFHHADDAYLTAKIGYFNQKVYCKNSSDIIKKFKEKLEEYAASGKDNTKRYEYLKELLEEDNYGFIAYLFSKGTGFWHGQQEIRRIADNCNQRDYFIKYLTEEQTGEFYGQTKMPKGAGTIPLSAKCNNIDIYGGYTGDNEAYSIIGKKGKNKKLVGVPIRIAALGEDGIAQYLKTEGYEGVSTRKIYKYQQVKYKEGDKISDYLITASGEVINARQLYLKDETMFYLNRLFDGRIKDEREANERYRDVFRELIYRMEAYACYQDIVAKFNANINEFDLLSIDDKKSEIKNLLISMRANQERIENGKWMVKSVTAGTRLRKKLKVENIMFVDKSITGMHAKLQKA